MNRREIELPTLAGLGVNVRASIPGAEVTTQDGTRRWLVGHDEDRYHVEEDPDHGMFLVSAPWLPGTLAIAEEDIAAAAAQVANLIAARMTAAMRAAETHADILDLFNDEWTCAILRAGRTAA